MYRPAYNPYATPALVGGQQQSTQWVDIPFNYVYDRTLLAGERLESESVPIDNDSDFMLRAIQLGAGPSTFNFLVYDSQGYYLMDDPLPGNVLVTNFRYMPMPVIPDLPFPAGSSIGLRVNNLDVAQPITIQLIFCGVKRYYLRGQA